MADHSESPVVFRTSKKRKYRQKATDTEALDDVPVKKEVDDTIQFSVDQKVEEDEAALAEALKLRHAHKSRLKGVAFRSDGGIKQTDVKAEVKKEDPDDASGSLLENAMAGAVKRFVPQTGIVGELVNKHMEEYIESELAKRHSAATVAAATASTPLSPSRERTSSSASVPGVGSMSPTLPGNKEPNRPAMHGKIMEIDLGEEARNKNASLTERATRKLHGMTVEDEETQPKKVRLGRDGKPYRPRNRRDSEDRERDRLVDEILRENRLDVYEVPAQQTTEEANGEIQAADDRIAEEFRREFMEAASQRRRKRLPAVNASRPPPAARGKVEEPILKGPKLGGSRNARAAVRDKLLEQQQRDQQRRR